MYAAICGNWSRQGVASCIALQGAHSIAAGSSRACNDHGRQGTCCQAGTATCTRQPLLMQARRGGSTGTPRANCTAPSVPLRSSNGEGGGWYVRLS